VLACCVFTGLTLEAPSLCVLVVTLWVLLDEGFGMLVVEASWELVRAFCVLTGSTVVALALYVLAKTFSVLDGFTVEALAFCELLDTF